MNLDKYEKDSGGYFHAYVPESLVAANTFIGKNVDDIIPPRFEIIRGDLPLPIWESRPDAVEAYYRAWEIAFGNLRRPLPDSSFVASFIDPAFNGRIFMWDSIFMLLYGRYADRVFPFSKTMDNFYALQHPDGFICREIDEKTGSEQFHRHDPSSTGPNLLAWYELNFFYFSGDTARLAAVFPVIVAYHRWMRRYRTWQDGTYFTSGWGCGMDNQPRFDESLSLEFYHGKISWIDATSQALISARAILEAANILEKTGEVTDMEAEAGLLETVINQSMWDENEAWYGDKHANGEVSKLKTIGSYWTLLSGATREDRLARFVSHLKNPTRFARKHRPPTLSADDQGYDPAGGYWRGSVWSPTAYMTLAGLRATGFDALAHEIALNHHKNVCAVFESTGTFWENYAPDSTAPGSLSGKEFVGWTGLSVISVLFEFVFGITANWRSRELVWDIRIPDRHGVQRFPFGPSGTIDLISESFSSDRGHPRVRVSSNVDLNLIIRYNGAEKRFAVLAGTHDRCFYEEMTNNP